MLFSPGNKASASKLEAIVQYEQAIAVYRNLMTAISVSFVLSITVAFVFSDKTQSNILLVWFIGNFTVCLLRCMIQVKYRNTMLKEENVNRLFLRFACAGAFVNGLSWACTPFIYGIDNSGFNYLVIVICGIVAGSSLQSAPYFMAGMSFVMPVITALCLTLFLASDLSHHALLLTIILFFGFLVRSGWGAQGAFRASSRLKHEAAALAESLTTEHDALTVANARLYEFANHDSLTGLWNRAAFSSALETRSSAAAASGQSISLFLIDLDHFKLINDRLGHKAGDDVLREVGARLRTAICPGMIVARLGGDEFAVLASGLPTAESRQALADSLMRVTTGAFTVADRPVNIAISVGTASFPDDCATSEDLIARADLALYAAKDAGRLRSRQFETKMLAAAEIARDIERDLPIALNDGSLEVWYQPQIALADNKFVGIEALIRWNHPRHSWIAPPQIVAAALRTHCSKLLTGFVLKDASAKIQQLRAVGLDDVLLAVNMSPSELDQYDVPDLLRDMIDHHGLDPRRLELEITEDAFVGSDTAITTLNAVSAMGVRLAIDDFGTGCSSIAYFRSLHVDRIKIDRSFVTGFAAREGDRTLVRTMLGIGQSLNIDVVAEGIETAEEADLLRRFGCHVGQGYFFGRPMAPDALNAWVLRRTLSKFGCPIVEADEVIAPVSAVGF